LEGFEIVYLQHVMQPDRILEREGQEADIVISSICFWNEPSKTCVLTREKRRLDVDRDLYIPLRRQRPSHPFTRKAF
jgi:hypothetical protein